MRALLSFLVFSSMAFGSFTSLSFDGLQNGEQVLNYYNGGFGGSGSGPGPNAGVWFTSGLAASTNVIAFGNSAVLTAPSVTMDLSSPFTGGAVSFYFQGTGSIIFFSGLDGTGLQVASGTLAALMPFGINVGPFQSAVFASSTGLTVDSVTLAPPGFSVLPEPGDVELMIGGLAAIGLLIRRRSVIG